MSEFPIQDSTLNRAMSLPPSELSDQDITDVVEVLRNAREQFATAKAEAKASGKKVKAPKVDVNLDMLGLGKGKLI